MRQGNWHMLVRTLFFFFFFLSPIGEIITRIMSSSSFCHFECHAGCIFASCVKPEGETLDLDGLWLISGDSGEGDWRRPMQLDYVQ